ncbi:MAG: acylphosphatase [Ktedonobacteraceae bacterium]
MMWGMNQSSPNELQELRAVVRGRVQGVGFRYFVVRSAQPLGLRGYARNESNGDVEVLAQGARSALERLLSLLRQGPPSAHVSEVTTTWRQPGEHLSGFHVRW